MNFITQDIPIRGGLASQIQQYMSLYAVATETNKEIVFRESLIGKGGGFAFNKILNIPVRLESDSFFENFTQFEHNHSLIVDKSCFDLNLLGILQGYLNIAESDLKVISLLDQQDFTLL